MKPDAAAVIAHVIATAHAAYRPDNLALTLQAITASLVDLGIADMAGLTERDGFDRFSTTAATESAVEEVDALQYRLNEGPCVAAIYDDGVVVSGDVTDDKRWPRWGPGAAGLGVRAALSAHLYTNRGTFGALNLYMRDVQGLLQRRSGPGESLCLARLHRVGPFPQRSEPVEGRRQPPPDRPGAGHPDAQIRP